MALASARRFWWSATVSC